MGTSTLSLAYLANFGYGTALALCAGARAYSHAVDYINAQRATSEHGFVFGCLTKPNRLLRNGSVPSSAGYPSRPSTDAVSFPLGRVRKCDAHRSVGVKPHWKHAEKMPRKKSGSPTRGYRVFFNLVNDCDRDFRSLRFLNMAKRSYIDDRHRSNVGAIGGSSSRRHAINRLEMMTTDWL